MPGKRVVGDLLRVVYKHMNYHTVVMPSNTTDTNHTHIVRGEQYCLPHTNNIFPREKTFIGEERGREGEVQEKKCGLHCEFQAKTCVGELDIFMIYCSCYQGVKSSWDSQFCNNTMWWVDPG